MSSRRPSARWSAPLERIAPEVDVLIPTFRRPAELALTLAGLAAQDDPAFRVIVSDQSDDAESTRSVGVQAMARVLRAQGREVILLRHLPRRGLAEHRQFLLDASSAPRVLFLDDDVWLEPGSIARLVDALDTLGCGFTGSAVLGLSYLDDRRPHEHDAFEPWVGDVHPEIVRRDDDAFRRWPLHNAANPVHLAEKVELADEWMAYRIAWIGGCVLYRRAALVECGGFDFWRSVPADHAGEDVAAQWRVMERFGGAGILPSGAVHLEAPTTLPNRDVEVSDLIFDSSPTSPPTPGPTRER